MEFTKITIRSTALTVSVLDGVAYVVSGDVATKLLGWQQASLRKELQMLNFPRKLIHDRVVLQRICQHVKLGDGPAPARYVKHLTLLEAEKVEELLNLLAKPTSRTSALAVRIYICMRLLACKYIYVFC